MGAKMKKEKRELTLAEKKRRGKKIRKWVVLALLAVIVVFIIFFRQGGESGQNMVLAERPVRGDIEEEVSLSGTVESEEVKVYFAPASGRIADVFASAGEEVAAGDLLIGYDMESMQEALDEARLQYMAGNSSYNGTLYNDRDAQAKLNEAETNLAVLEQQIKDAESYVKQLNKQLTNIQTGNADKLAVENLNLQKQLILLQKDPLKNEDAIVQVQIALQANQYATQSLGNSDAEKTLREGIEAEEERIAALREDKAEMEAQKQQAEAALVGRYQKENLSATEELNLLAYEKIQADFAAAQSGITADFNGIVMEIGVVAGAAVPEGTQLLTLADSEKIKVVVHITRYDLEKIEVGQQADVTINGSVYEGSVAKIDRMATVNASGNATVRAEIHIENPDDKIYLGLEAKAVIHTDSAKGALLIPLEALNADRNGDFVYIEENGMAVRRPVVTGISSDEYIEIKEGLSETDNVITASYSGAGIEEGMQVYVLTQEAAE